MEYDNELPGALLRNDKKVKETDKDFQGEVTVEGKVHSLPLRENVKLYREFNGRENVLCVENACFDVPYDRNHTAY